jgi:hypothetical protein
MQQILVERWTFLAGVVTIALSYVYQALIGQQYNPATGVSYDYGAAFYLIALALFLLSYAIGGPRPVAAVSPGPPSSG